MPENKNRMTTRERIVNDKIEQARHDVITHQLELDFLKSFKEKNDKGEVNVSDLIYGGKNIENLIQGLEDCCVYDLERLNFYKGVRDSMDKKRIEKAAKKASAELEKYPETIDTSKMTKVEVK